MKRFLSLGVTWCVVLAGCRGSSESTTDPVLGNVEEVEIRVDDMGVTHIYAASDQDLFHAAGYQMAKDRLYQAEMLLRFAKGTLSEVLGEEALTRDQQARIFDFESLGAADRAWMEATDPERAGLLRAWVDGINRRIDEVHAEEAPRPFGYGPDEHDFLPTHWTDDDPYITLKGANFAIDLTLEFEIAVSLVSSLYPDAMEEVELFRPGRQVFCLPEGEQPVSNDHSGDMRGSGLSLDLDEVPPEVFEWLTSLSKAHGSNSWVVDGRHTETGRSMLAGDPHIEFDFFGAPYPLHLDSKREGGSYAVAGFAFPGTPGVALGHTERVAWTATSAFADTMDVWLVQRDGDSVVVDGEPWPVVERDEEFVVRGPGDVVGEGTLVSMEFASVEGVGSLLPEEFLPLPMGEFLVGWTGSKPRRASWFMELNRTESIDDFEEAVDQMGEMNYNFVGATADEIAYRVGVSVPDRGQVGGVVTPWQSMDGTTSATFWTGAFLPDSEKPRSRGVDRGWLATANNDPWGFSGNGRFDDDPWYYGSLFAPGYRAQRIHDLLEDRIQVGEITLDDMREMQLDTHSTLADDLLPLLVAAHARIGVDPSLDAFADQPALDAVVELLAEEWDGNMDRDSAGALAFHLFLRELTDAVLQDDIALAYDFALGLHPVFLMKVGALALQGAFGEGGVLQDGPDAALLEAASDTANWIDERYGRVLLAEYAFEDMKVTRFDHALGYGVALEDRATDGGEDPIDVGQSIDTPLDGSPWVTTHVSVERMVVTFDEDGTPKAWVTFPYPADASAEGDVADEAMETFVDGVHRQLWFERDDVVAATRDVEWLEAY